MSNAEREHYFRPPNRGDIVLCRYPEDRRGIPAKTRTVLIVAVGVDDDDDKIPMVRVAPGTSRKIMAGQVYPWEFLIQNPAPNSALQPSNTVNIELRDLEAFKLSGLSYTTKFNLRQLLELPYSSKWFPVPDSRPFGKTPKLGTLHASYVRDLQLAYQAAVKPTRD